MRRIFRVDNPAKIPQARLSGQESWKTNNIDHLVRSRDAPVRSDWVPVGLGTGPTGYPVRLGTGPTGTQSD